MRDPFVPMDLVDAISKGKIIKCDSDNVVFKFFANSPPAMLAKILYYDVRDTID